MEIRLFLYVVSLRGIEPALPGYEILLTITFRTYTMTPDRYSHPCQYFGDRLHVWDPVLSLLLVGLTLDSDKTL